jgi:hypothetical protein
MQVTGGRPGRVRSGASQSTQNHLACQTISRIGRSRAPTTLSYATSISERRRSRESIPSLDRNLLRRSLWSMCTAQLDNAC